MAVNDLDAPNTWLIQTFQGNVKMRRAQWGVPLLAWSFTLSAFAKTCRWSSFALCAFLNTDLGSGAGHSSALGANPQPQKSRGCTSQIQKWREWNNIVLESYGGIFDKSVLMTADTPQSISGSVTKNCIKTVSCLGCNLHSFSFLRNKQA